MNYMSFALNYLGIAAFGILSAVNGKLANKKLESAINKVINSDIRYMSGSDVSRLVDNIAAILISVLPNVTYEIGRPYKVPIQGGYIYYGTNVNGTLRPGEESSVNVIMESERNKFKDFSASVGMGGYIFTAESNNVFSISGYTDMGTSSASVSMKIDTSTGKVAGEYLSTVNAQGNISLTTILGFEKDMGRDTWRNLQNSFDNIVDTVTDAVTSFAKNVVQGIKDIFSNPLSAVAIIGGLLVFKTPLFA